MGGVSGVSERKFHGLDSDGMESVFMKMVDIEDRIALSDEEERVFDICIQCVAQIHNRMLDGKEITWDD